MKQPKRLITNAWRKMLSEAGRKGAKMRRPMSVEARERARQRMIEINNKRNNQNEK